MHAAARLLRQSDVSGQDLVALTIYDLQHGLSVNPFLAAKIVHARNEFILQ